MTAAIENKMIGDLLRNHDLPQLRALLTAEQCRVIRLVRETSEAARAERVTQRAIEAAEKIAGRR